jgi:hypothetical protein
VCNNPKNPRVATGKKRYPRKRIPRLPLVPMLRDPPKKARNSRQPLPRCKRLFSAITFLKQPTR